MSGTAGRPPYAYAMARRALELLGDGQWHPYEKTMRELMKLVPPGPAVRRTERDRRYAHKQRGKVNTPPPERKRPLSREDQIYSGQRAIVRDFLRSEKTFEADKPGHPHPGGNVDRQIRMLRTPPTIKAPRPRMVEQYRAEVERLGAQVAAMRAYLIEIGHDKAAKELAPEMPETKGPFP